MIRKIRSSFQRQSFRTALAVRNLLFCVLTLTASIYPKEAIGQNESVSAAPAARIIAPPPSFHFPEGQKFVYSVEWHMLNAGTATVLIQHANSGEHVRSTADTSGMVNKIYSVHDTFDSDVDPHSLCTQQISKHSEEGARRLDRKVHFDYQTEKSQVDEFDLKAGKEKHVAFDIPPCVTDVVSGFFYVSSLDLRPGTVHTFPLNDGGKTTEIRIEVEGHDKVKVPSGEFQTVRVKAEPTSGPMQGKGVLRVWFTDDARHVPVQMRSKLGFATLLFRLERIESETTR